MKHARLEARYPKETMHDEVGEATKLLLSGNFVQVVGLPGTGKSTLLRLLAYNEGVCRFHFGEACEKFIFVYMNFSEVKKRNLRDVTKLMLFSLSQSVKERGITEVESKIENGLSEALSRDDEMLYFQYLKQGVELIASNGYTTVLLIDRLEVYFPYLDERFFTHLRSLRNSAKNSFSAIFSLDRPIDMSLDREVAADIYGLVAGNTVFVGFHHPEGLDFRLDELESRIGKKCSDKIRKQLVEITGGHGQMSKVGYEAVLTEGCVQDDLVAFLLGRRQMRAVLSDIWNYFTPEEQNRLLGDVGDVSSQFLKSLGILRNGQLSIPLFAEYLKGEKDKFQKLSYDAEKRAIMRGVVDITEQFSASEFRLLQYLLEHTGETVPRELLIDFVWGELASREGVTPQAFDQLVYRVRKKIEKDPSSALVLQTIKGRGYKIN